jgi:transcriptional regulator with XRE-family HTH domain
LQRIREEHGWTLSDVSEKTGVAAATLAKIETNQTSPNVDVLCRLHDGLGVEFGELFQGRRFSRSARASRAVNRVGGGIRHETLLGEYQLLSGELSKKAFQPMLVRVPKGKQEPILSSHGGEKFLYVVSGPLRFYMEPYSAVLLETGESVHFDATMPHGFTAAGDEDAWFLAVCQSPNSSDGGA